MHTNVRRHVRDAQLQRLRPGSKAWRAVRKFRLPQVQKCKDLALRGMQGQAEKVSVRFLRARRSLGKNFEEISHKLPLILLH
jgi:hypothetical protein